MTIARDSELDPAADPAADPVGDTAGRPRVGRRRAAAIVCATTIAFLVWVVADPVAGVDLNVGSRDSARTVGPAAVALVSALAGVAAVSLAALLARVTSRARPIWRIVAVGTLVLSLVGPLGAATLAAGVALAAMHLAVGATLIAGIDRTLEGARRLEL